MNRHDFPPTAADEFPAPPRTVEDVEGREIVFREVELAASTGGPGAGADDVAADDDGTTDAGAASPADAAAADAADAASAADPTTVDDAASTDDAASAADDRAALVAMYEDFDPSQRAQGVPPAGTDRIRHWLDVLLGEGINVLARHDGAVVGHAVLMPDAEDDWELAIFVHQDHQEAGIGTALLRTLLGLGRERGVERVWLTVERWNRPAIALYERVGFEPSDAERFELGMSMRLAGAEDD